MREIKFRAWHEGHPIGVDPQMIYDETPGDCLVWKSQRQPLVIMQYTGLKDRNGVEIYDNDEICDNIGTGIVVYSEIRAAYNVIYKDGLRKWFVDYTDNEIKTIEVIGNVFERDTNL